MAAYERFGAVEPSAGNSYSVYTAVQCRDSAWPRDWNQWRADMWRTHAKAPFMTWNNAWYNAPCAFWPTEPLQAPDVTNADLPPALLLQATEDAATPFAGALSMRDKLKGSALVVEEGGGNHGIALSGNKCLDEKVAAYLRTGTGRGRHLPRPGGPEAGRRRPARSRPRRAARPCTACSASGADPGRAPAEPRRERRRQASARSAVVAATARRGWDWARVRSSRARGSPRAPRPSTQARATRQYGSCGDSSRDRVVSRAGTDSGARRAVSSRTGLQGVGRAQAVGGEGGRRAGGARVAQDGQRLGGGRAAGRVPVVEQQHEGLEGAAVPREAQPVRGQFAGPQGQSGRGQGGRQGVGAGREQHLVLRVTAPPPPAGAPARRSPGHPRGRGGRHAGFPEMDDAG